MLLAAMSVDVLISFTVQSITGFGGALLAMPVAILLVGMDSAGVALNGVSWLTGTLVAVKNWRNINWRQLARICVCMFVGILMGLWLYDRVNHRLLQVLYGAVIILMALRNLLIRQRKNLPMPALVAVLFFAGIMHGLFVSGGAFLMIYAMQTMPEKQMFRATSCSVWGLMNLYMIASQWSRGLLTPASLRLTAFCIPPALLAFWLAERLQKKIEQERFLRLTNLLLLCTGALMLLK